MLPPSINTGLRPLRIGRSPRPSLNSSPLSPISPSPFRPSNDSPVKTPDKKFSKKSPLAKVARGKWKRKTKGKRGRPPKTPKPNSSMQTSTPVSSQKKKSGRKPGRPPKDPNKVNKRLADESTTSIEVTSPVKRKPGRPPKKRDNQVETPVRRGKTSGRGRGGGRGRGRRPGPKPVSFNISIVVLGTEASLIRDEWTN